MLKNIILVALGGSIGSVSRYLLSYYFKNGPFPYTTFLINITGSFLIGLIIAYCTKESSEEATKLFLATGICGGFTTFSAFSYENMLLIQSGKFNQAVAYILLSVVIGIAATWCGYKLINV